MIVTEGTGASVHFIHYFSPNSDDVISCYHIRSSEYMYFYVKAYSFTNTLFNNLSHNVLQNRLYQNGRLRAIIMSKDDKKNEFHGRLYLTDYEKKYFASLWESSYNKNLKDVGLNLFTLNPSVTVDGDVSRLSDIRSDFMKNFYNDFDTSVYNKDKIEIIKKVDFGDYTREEYLKLNQFPVRFYPVKSLWGSHAFYVTINKYGVIFLHFSKTGKRYYVLNKSLGLGFKDDYCYSNQNGLFDKGGRFDVCLQKNGYFDFKDGFSGYLTTKNPLKTIYISTELPKNDDEVYGKYEHAKKDNVKVLDEVKKDYKPKGLRDLNVNKQTNKDASGLIIFLLALLMYFNKKKKKKNKN